MIKQLPTPPWSAIETLGRLIFNNDPLKLIEDANLIAGDLFRLDFLFWSACIIRDPEVIKELGKHYHWNIIVKNPVSKESTTPVQQSAGDFNLLSDGYFHKHYRDTLARQFTRERIDSYIDILVSMYLDSAGRWTEEGPVDIANDITKVIVSVIFGGMHGFQFTAEEYQYIRLTLAKVAKLQKSWLLFGRLSTSVFNPNAIGYRRMTNRVRQILDNRAEEVRRCPFSTSYIHDFMQRELNNRNSAIDIGRKKIIDDMFGLLVAGVETVASTLMWSIRILLDRPDIISRIRKEANGVLSNGGDIRRDYDQLQFARSVFLETLRLYPVFPVLPRITVEEMAIRGYRVPAKSWIFIPVYTIHRDERWYSKPHEYNPDRWLNNTWGQDADFRYIPFGFDTHRCAGWELALIEGSVVLALFYSQFDVQSLHKLPDYTASSIPSRYSYTLAIRDQPDYMLKRI